MLLSKGIPALLHYLMLDARGTSAEQRLMQLLLHHQGCCTSDPQVGLWEHI